MQVVVHLLLQGISVSFLVQWRFLTNNMNWVALHFCPIRGCNSHHIHVFMDSDMHYWLTFGRYLCANIHVILEVWVHKGSNLTLEKVGVGINPATDVTHFRFYFSCVVSVIHLATILKLWSWVSAQPEMDNASKLSPQNENNAILSPTYIRFDIPGCMHTQLYSRSPLECLYV